MSDLLVTKLHRPSIPLKWVQRSHLVQRLNEGLEFERKLTLVSTPAGFGKTTCVSEGAELGQKARTALGELCYERK